MHTFTIDESALTEIRQRIKSHEFIRPVVVLIDMADPGELFDDVKAALLTGGDQKDLSLMGEKRFKEIENQLMYYLDISVQEQNSFKHEELITIKGIIFKMNPVIQNALRDYTLTFEDNRFIFRSVNDVAVNLQTVLMKNNGSNL